MFDAETLKNILLVVCAVFLSATIFLCLARAALGPRYSDRIIAANIVSTKIILLIAVLSLIIGEGYLADVCLIYAARSVIEKKEGAGE